MPDLDQQDGLARALLIIPKPSCCFESDVDWELENLTGNNLLRLFEMDVAHTNPPTFAGPRYLRFDPK